MSEGSATRRRILKSGAAVLTAGLAGCSTSRLSENAPPAQSASPPPEVDSTSDSPYTRVYQETIQSVVLVQAGEGQGTGFVYDDNHVITNAHVVGETTTVNLRFGDGTWTTGRVRGTDVHSDLAAIAAETIPESATPLPFEGGHPAVGREVAAVGNPYNLDGTLTTGVVSGIDRLIPAPSGYQIPDAIQTDAAVNPGNSGGPLMTKASTVLGVVNSKQGDNIGFGISAALTQRVVPQLITTGDYDHAYMGVSLQTVGPAIAEANNLARPRGLIVVETVPGGPSEGRLRESQARIVGGQRVPVGGDILLRLGNTELQTFEDLASYLALQTRPGDTVQVTLLRNGSEQTVDIELGSRPERSQSPLR